MSDTRTPITMDQLFAEWHEVNPEIANTYHAVLMRFGELIGKAVDAELQNRVPARKLRSQLKQLNDILDNLEAHLSPMAPLKGAQVVNRASTGKIKAVGIVYDKNGMPRIDNPQLFKQKYPELWASFTEAQRAFLGD